MIYNDEYSGFKSMTLNDISSVLSLMDPFVKREILLPRTKAQLAEKLDDYVVYQVDGGIHACAALHIYNNSEAEIAAVAVDESYSKLGIGVKLINFLLKKAKEKSLQSVFVLTTQTADWFEKLESDKNARIVRNLCALRTALEQNYSTIYKLMRYEMKNLHSMPELIPQGSLQQLMNDGITIERAIPRMGREQLR